MHINWVKLPNEKTNSTKLSLVSQATTERSAIYLYAWDYDVTLVSHSRWPSSRKLISRGHCIVLSGLTEILVFIWICKNMNWWILEKYVNTFHMGIVNEQKLKTRTSLSQHKTINKGVFLKPEDVSQSSHTSGLRPSMRDDWEKSSRFEKKNIVNHLLSAAERIKKNS